MSIWAQEFDLTSDNGFRLLLLEMGISLIIFYNSIRQKTKNQNFVTYALVYIYLCSMRCKPHIFHQLVFKKTSFLARKTLFDWSYFENCLSSQHNKLGTISIVFIVHETNSYCILCTTIIQWITKISRLIISGLPTYWAFVPQGIKLCN